MPEAILNPGQMLLELSHNQGYLTTFNYAPYIIASAQVTDSNNNPAATLMLVSPLDEEFLIASQGATLAESSVIALLAESEPTILVSSNSSKVPPGIRLDTLSDNYLQIGQGFFDYGATDIIIELVSFVSTDEVQLLTHDVLQEERPLRILTAFAFILAFASLMFMVTKRLKKFTAFVVQFSKNLHIDHGEHKNSGDEITILEDNFYPFVHKLISVNIDHRRLCSIISVCSHGQTHINQFFGFVFAAGQIHFARLDDWPFETQQGAYPFNQSEVKLLEFFFVSTQLVFNRRKAFFKIWSFLVILL